MMKMESSSRFFIKLLLLVLFISSAFGQTTGKIAGRVVDRKNGQPLVGANVIVENTSYGSATDMNGDYFIINLAPGNYNIKAQMIGYDVTIVQDIRVSVNRTSFVNFELTQGILEGETVVVEAAKISLKRDQTSTVKNVSADVIELLPVEDLSSIVSMQAGIVNGHFRGGRLTEVSYLVDGLQVDESYSGEGRTVELETDAIADLEVITGTFNAEYGRAMSGIVNAVTKTGDNTFHGSFSGALGNYFTANDDIFIGLDPAEITRNQDYKFNLSGPIIRDKLHFYVNYRYRDNKNHLNGIRRFKVNDFSYYAAAEPAMWYTENTGDSQYVAMDRDIMKSIMAKVSTRLFNKINLSFLYTNNNDEWHSYNHEYKFNPDGMACDHRNSTMMAVNLNHSLTPKLFYELKYSRVKNDYGYYLYESPSDSNYIHDIYLSSYGPGFFTGGQDKTHTLRTTIDQNLKFDMTWQASKHHKFKLGAAYIDHQLNNKERTIMNYYRDYPDEEDDFNWILDENGNIKVDFYNYIPVILDDSTEFTEIYSGSPKELSAYIQDEVSYGDLIFNIGLRYDQFDPNARIPSNRRNPDNTSEYYLEDENGNPLEDDDGNFILDEERMSTFDFAPVKKQLSPRFGLSYTLAKTAVLHFSYGHFFNNPPMYALYQRYMDNVPNENNAIVYGNPAMNAEKTVQYEVGLWQELMPGMDLDVTLFYRDIYDLLSAVTITTYGGISYGLYGNKDYGNVRGLEVQSKFFHENFSAILNYTLQYTRGNADEPMQTYSRAGENIDPIPKLIHMSWDQRHTLNITMGYNTSNYGANLTGYYNSGTPYTWTPLEYSRIFNVNLYSNNAWQPSGFSIDLTSYYLVRITENIKLKFTLAVYNVMDRLNEQWVYSSSGRAYTNVIEDNEKESYKSDFSTVEETYQNPSMYVAPRMIKLGLGITF